MYIAIERMSKFVYATIDLEKKLLIFGNMFSPREVGLDKVKIEKPGGLRKILYKNTYRIQIETKYYFFDFLYKKDLEDFLKKLDLDINAPSKD
jgi:hypothetical protein